MLPQAAAACLYLAAQSSRVPPAIVASILHVEGGRIGTRSRDADGSDDLGPGQINSFWLKEVGRAVGRKPAEAERLLQWDGCFNVRATAAILRYEIDRAGGDFWTGVAHYHSHDTAEGLRYVRKVVAAARKLFGPGVFARR